ncbi:MAG: DUF3343 domain-containing protein [Bacillota bacterium]
MGIYCYLTFPTTYFAIRAEDLLKSRPYHFKMVPVPRSISSSCGTALRCLCPDVSGIKRYLTENNVQIDGVHQLEEKVLKPPKLFTQKGKP